MAKHIMTALAILALGCGDSADECEDAQFGLPSSPQELPPADDAGEPWPTYSEASELPCTQDAGYRVRRGTCSDGKRFIERNGGFEGDTRFYEGETLVGIDPWTDIIFPCVDNRRGDTRCKRTSEEEIACP